MLSLRRNTAQNDGPTARFLYAILRQLDTRSVDWNQVSEDVEGTNGHAARMRYSRFKAHMEGTGSQVHETKTPQQRRQTKNKTRKKSQEKPRRHSKPRRLKKEPSVRSRSSTSSTVHSPEEFQDTDRQPEQSDINADAGIKDEPLEEPTRLHVTQEEMSRLPAEVEDMAFDDMQRYFMDASRELEPLLGGIENQFDLDLQAMPI